MTAPTIGRIVHYTLSEIDASLITGRRAHAGATGNLIPANMVQAGETYPAVIVRTFGATAVNLKVLLDGDDNYWACSRTPHDEVGIPGTWAWPPLGGPVVGECG